MDITNTIRLYAECISGGAITEPTGGSWMSAICIWQGSTEPLNASWLQRHCDNLGITAPLNGSWLIALADHYGETEPINGTWANAILIGCGAVPTDLIWNLTTTEWQDETTEWATLPQPTVAIANQSFTDDSTPTIVGTTEPNNSVEIFINTNTYNGLADGNGDWAIQVTDALPGTPSPGTDYTCIATATNVANGLKSTPMTAQISIIANVAVITVQMVDAYGDGWNGGSIAIQREVTPGVWELVEYDGNPYYYSSQANFNTDLPQNRIYYKDGPQTPYGILFESYEYGVSTGGLPPYPQGTVWLDSQNIRTISLTPGFNYRSIAWFTGNYPEERSYYILNGATELAYQPRTNATEWAQDYVQQTFTL